MRKKFCQKNKNDDDQGWEDLGGDYCYKMMLDQWVSWGEAHTNCWMAVETVFSFSIEIVSRMDMMQT